MSEIQSNFKNSFLKKLKLAETPPFLFVGSGISKRYCKIPTWFYLLEDFVNKYPDCFQKDYGYFSSKALNDPLLIATNLAEIFHEYWWSSDEFAVSRKENSKVAGTDPESAFKIEISKFINSKQGESESLKTEIELFSKAILSGILTTNWDNFLENLFPEFEVAVGQKEAIFANQQAIGNLYKIHGCSLAPESLIVTTKDYEKFQLNNHFLNAKILTIFAEYPIVFVGYSLTDPNIEVILGNLISCLSRDLLHHDKLQNRLFFVEYQDSPCETTIENSSYVSKSITIPLTKIKAHSYIEIWEVLSEFPRTLSVKILRHLQDMVFEFVSSSKPKKKIFVNGFDELKKIEDLEVVVGFGNMSKLNNKGIVGLKDKDLIEDILFDNLPSENYLEIVKNLLPGMVKQNVFIPFFKYQKMVENLNSDNSIKAHKGRFLTLKNAQNITIDDYRVKTNLVKTMKNVERFNSLEDLINNESFSHIIYWVPFLSLEKINVETLRSFLKDNWSKFSGNEVKYSSPFRKCICLLDYLEFANHK